MYLSDDRAMGLPNEPEVALQSEIDRLCVNRPDERKATLSFFEKSYLAAIAAGRNPVEAKHIAVSGAYSLLLVLVPQARDAVLASVSKPIAKMSFGRAWRPE